YPTIMMLRKQQRTPGAIQFCLRPRMRLIQIHECYHLFGADQLVFCCSYLLGYSLCNLRAPDKAHQHIFLAYFPNRRGVGLNCIKILTPGYILVFCREPIAAATEGAAFPACILQSHADRMFYSCSK